MEASTNTFGMGYRFRQADKERLEATRQYLLMHLHLPLRIDDLCRIALMNKHKLNQGFERFYGKKVHSYVLSKRMEKARQLLQEGEASVGDIAEACGYAYASNFSKAYLRYWGRLPKKDQGC